MQIEGKPKKLKIQKQNFYDDSIPTEAKLVLYSIGELRQNSFIKAKIKNKPKTQKKTIILKKCNSMEDFSFNCFDKTPILPYSMNKKLKVLLKEVNLIC
jgi:hypothetical protein